MLAGKGLFGIGFALQRCLQLIALDWRRLSLLGRTIGGSLGSDWVG